MESPNIKSILTKLRIGNSVLLADSLRNSDDKSYPLCEMGVHETVQHFICECPCYLGNRNSLFHTLNKYINNFESLPIETKILIILDLKHELVYDKANINNFTVAVCKFIKDLYTHRLQNKYRK